MASAAGNPDDPRRRVAPFQSSPLQVVRGLNLLAELEALCVLGAGRFEVGVRHVLNVFRGAPLAELSGMPIPTPFEGRVDKRHWRCRIYEEDAYLLARMGSSPSLSLSHVLGVTWPHVPAAYRELVVQRLADLSEDSMARAWHAAGGAPWWEPPPAPGRQTHFVLDEPAAFHDLGVRQ